MYKYFKIMKPGAETWHYIKVDPSQKTADQWVVDMYVGQMNAAEITEEEYLEASAE